MIAASTTAIKLAIPLRPALSPSRTTAGRHGLMPVASAASDSVELRDDEVEPVEDK